MFVQHGFQKESTSTQQLLKTIKGISYIFSCAALVAALVVCLDIECVAASAASTSTVASAVASAASAAASASRDVALVLMDIFSGDEGVVYIGVQGAMRNGVEVNTYLLRHFMLTMIAYPRQARDRHRDTSQRDVCSDRTSPGFPARRAACAPSALPARYTTRWRTASGGAATGRPPSASCWTTRYHRRPFCTATPTPSTLT